MEREKLKALLERSAESGWSLQSGAQLQEWLETFSANVKARVEDLNRQVEKLADQTSSVEQELKNTFNTFRLLSNSQFIENRVYEEDEMLITNQNAVKEQLRPDTYENDIIPRYKDAVSMAWTAHEHASKFARARHRHLPCILGTEEFMRDPHCGLPDPRKKTSVSDAQEYDSEAEKDGVNMAAEMIGSGVISEGEWSEPSSEEQDNHEPAVSAALDFKAMLEAALRAPYVPYDGVSQDEFKLYDELPSTNMANGTAKDDDSRRDLILREEDQSSKIMSARPVAEEVQDEDKATMHDILGKISQEVDSHHSMPAEIAEERGRTEINPTTAQLLSSITVNRRPEMSSDESSSWSSDDDNNTESVKITRPEPNIIVSRTELDVSHEGQEEESVRQEDPQSTISSESEKAISSSGVQPEVSEATNIIEESLPTITTSEASSRFKSLFDDGDEDDEEFATKPELLKPEVKPELDSPKTMMSTTEPMEPNTTDSPKEAATSSKLRPAQGLGTSTLSSLLFGDDDEDEDEAALFGPIGSSKKF